MQLPARTVPLLEAVFPRSNITRDALFIVAFSLITAGFARISIPLPFTPVPITGQTLAVLLTGAVLGSRRGALAMLAYLAEGSAGLPVFATLAFTDPQDFGRLSHSYLTLQYPVQHL